MGKKAQRRLRSHRIYLVAGAYQECRTNVFLGDKKEKATYRVYEALETRFAPIIPTEYVTEMIETVLENNTFNLGNHHYKQTERIAIDSRLGKKFACSYMRKWDEELL